MKKIFIAVIALFLFILIVFLINFSLYLVKQKRHEIGAENCIENSIEAQNCSIDMLDYLFSKMYVYNFKTNGSKDFFQIERNFARLVPEFLFDKSDVLLGWGVSKDIDFEQNFSLIFNKPSYAFDCGIREISVNSSRCKFYSECIGTDKYVKTELGQVSSKKVHSFSQKIKELNLENKKLFVKISFAIEAEFEVLPEILRHKDKINAIVIALQVENNKDIDKAIKMLDVLNSDFVLVSRIASKLKKEEKEKYLNTDLYKGRLDNDLFFLVFANKNLLDNYSISLNQNDKLFYKLNKVFKVDVKNGKIKKRRIKNLEELNAYQGKIKFIPVFYRKIKEII